MTKDSHWLALEEPWQVALTLAWEAHIGGNVGVGAVLTDPRGRIVAVGRNRVSDKEAPPGRLRSTYIAHAEIDVLGQLMRGDYRHHTLWTTLESCPLCCMAIVMSNVGPSPMQPEIGSGTEYPGSRNSTNSSQGAGLFGVVRSAALFPCSLNYFRCFGFWSTSRVEASLRSTKANIRDFWPSPRRFAAMPDSPI